MKQLRLAGFIMQQICWKFREQGLLSLTPAVTIRLIASRVNGARCAVARGPCLPTHGRLTGHPASLSERGSPTNEPRELELKIEAG